MSSTVFLLPALNADVMAGALAAGIQEKGWEKHRTSVLALGSHSTPRATSAVSRQPDVEAVFTGTLLPVAARVSRSLCH